MFRLILILCGAMLVAGCASAVDYGPDEPLEPTPTSSGKGRAGFIALHGAAAAEFVVRGGRPPGSCEQSQGARADLAPLSAVG